jgi:hypothetical protein
MGVILVGTKVAVLQAGQKRTEAVLADDEGLVVGKVGRTVRKGLLKKQTIYVPTDDRIVAWDDVVGYEITKPDQSMFAGSDISSHDAILTLRTTATHLVLTVKHNNPLTLRSKLGPYLAKIDARQ